MKQFVQVKYPSLPELFAGVKSYDGNEYICVTCDKNVIKGKMPCQAVCNRTLVDEIPRELACLEKLESILIAQRLIVEKLIILPKGQQQKIRGAVVNVPINHETVCSTLPRPSSDSGIIMVKLKKKLQYKGHQYFQAVRPSHIVAGLQWLQSNNPLYDQVTINLDNFEGSSEMVNSQFTENESCETIENNGISNCLSNRSNITLDADDTKDIKNDTDEVEDPLNEFRNISGETCLQAYLPDYPTNIDSSSSETPFSDNSVSNSNVNTEIVMLGDEIVNIASGEGRHPVSLMNDEFCEELSFPTFFPRGRFGYRVERPVKISPTKYFNARLLHYSGRYAMNPEYLFFAQFLIEQKGSV